MRTVSHHILLLIAVLLLLPVAAAAELSVTFFDVGQGEAALIQADGKNMLIDAGPDEKADDLLSYLGDLGVKRLDLLLGTNPQEEHIGGMDEVLARYEVDTLWMPNTPAQITGTLLAAIQEEGLESVAPKPGTTYDLGDALITILSPASQTYENLNDYSIVLRVDYGDTSYLFTGDAGELAEREMLQNGLDVDADVLKVGNHGNSGSSSQAFVDAVSPTWAVYSCGKGNTNSSPDAGILTRLRGAGSSILGTDADGTVTFLSDGKTIELRKGIVGVSAAAAPSFGSKDPSYIGNKNSKAFHLPTCHTLPAQKNQVYFETRDEAISQGYKPCKKCKP